MGESISRDLISSTKDDITICSSVVRNGETVVELSKTEVELETQRWKHALILYVVGANPTIAALERFSFTAVYGLHTIKDRKSLWGKLRSINLRQQGPWLSMGDYNAIHRAEDRLIGSTIHEAETKDFDSFLKDTRMAILRANGREFTWAW
ncbi:hypothetical protein H5410_007180 [Solanum commersonii]|uniref:Uncharacterized protein n=1 Tax=Solanum commersonii TaxID=4109 RepID=A0A9J6ACR3_SOLCO|nr:hypothetical protein H5410_007180 [Solanum commersonii]